MAAHRERQHSTFTVQHSIECSDLEGQYEVWTARGRFSVTVNPTCQRVCSCKKVLSLFGPALSVRGHRWISPRTAGFSWAPPDFRGARPKFRGARPKFRGARPEFRGARPEFRGARPEFRGTRPKFRGARPKFRGARPKFRGTRPKFRGTRPEFRGTRPRLRGARPDFRDAPADSRGASPVFRACSATIDEGWTTAPSIVAPSCHLSMTLRQDETCVLDLTL
jgi:hypothetical protein